MVDYWNRLTGKERKDKKLRYNKLYKKIISGGGGEGGTKDYNELDPESLPKLENEVIKGSKYAEDYNLAKKEHLHKASDILDLPVIVATPKFIDLEEKSDDDEPVLLKSPSPNGFRSLVEVNDVIEPEIINTHNEYLLIDGKLEKIGIDEYPELFKLPKIEGVIVVGDKTAADYNLVSLTNLETVINEVKALIDSKQAKLVSGESIKKLSIDDAEIDLLGAGTVVIPTGGSGVSSYKSLPDQPTVEGNTLISSSDGDNSAESLGLAKAEHTHSEYAEKVHTHSELAEKIHTHGLADVTGLDTALNGKAETVHNHIVDDITDLSTTLENKQDKLINGTNIVQLKFNDEIVNLAGSGVVEVSTAEKTDVENLTSRVNDIDNKICTEFYKTSNIKSPSCAAIAGYIDEVLAGLDGSEVAF